MQIRRLRDANFNVAWIVLKATSFNGSSLGNVRLK